MGTSPKPVSVSVLATQLTTANSVFGLYDFFSSVGMAWEAFVTGDPELSCFDVRIVAPTDEPFLCGSHTLIQPNARFDDVTSVDVVVCPGVNALATEPFDASSEESVRTVAWLRKMQRSGARMTSVCTGALYLAEAGILDGMEATTHWAWANMFRAKYPQVVLRPERSLCFSDPLTGVVTAGGASAWHELALFLAFNYAGLESAVRLARFHQLPDPRGLQQQYMVMPQNLPHGDPVIAQVQEWIAENYAAPNPVAGMTRQSGLAPSTFARRFRRATGQAPKDYVHSVRLEEAKQILETTDDTVEEIAHEIGYEDTASFRRLFKRATRLTPGDYRRTLGKDRFVRYLNSKATAQPAEGKLERPASS